MAETASDASLTPATRVPTHAEVREIIATNRRTEPGLRRAVLADARRLAGLRGDRHEFDSRVAGWLDILRLTWLSDDFFGVALYRLRTALHAHGVPVVPRLIHRFSIMAFGIRIGEQVVVGPGLHLAHGEVCADGVVVIGANATLCPWITIGLMQGHPIGPRIGNNVFVGTGAKILGPITVGDRAMIAANAVVISDVPAGATAAGVPARIVREA